jgi:hypothetical protein
MGKMKGSYDEEKVIQVILKRRRYKTSVLCTKKHCANGLVKVVVKSLNNCLYKAVEGKILLLSRSLTL